MAPLKLYYDAMSQPSRAVQMLLLEGSVPFDIHSTMIAQGATRTHEFLNKVNPNGHIPAIDDDGVLLYESHTIMRYIVAKYKLADHWYPSELVARARIDQYLDWHHTYLRRGSAMLVFSTQFAKAFGQMTDEQIARESKQGAAILTRSVRRMEESYLPNPEGFLMGQNAISIADLSASTELFMTVSLVGVDLSPFPRVQAWLVRVQTALPKSWATAHAVLNKIVAGRLKKKAAKEAAKASSTDEPQKTQAPIKAKL